MHGLIRKVYFFATLVDCIRINTTPDRIFNELDSHGTVVLFESLRLQTKKSRELLVRILNNGRIPLHQDYARQKIDIKRATELLDYFKHASERQLYSMIPFALYAHNEMLVRAVKNSKIKYRPQWLEILPNEDFILSKDDLKQVAGKNITDHPERWASRELLLKATDIGILNCIDKMPSYHKSWRKSAALFYTISSIRFFYERRHQPNIEKVIRTWSITSDAIVETSSKRTGFGIQLDHFNDQLKSIRMMPDPIMRASWHAKLLIITLQRYNIIIERHSLAKADQLQDYLIDFFTEHRFEDIPPYLIEEIIQFPLLRLVSPLPHLDVFHKVDFFLPHSGGFWGGLREFAFRWQYRLRQIGQHKRSPPIGCQKCSDGELIRWWANYGEIIEVLLERPSFDPPIKLPRRRGFIVCDNADRFLGYMTKRLSGLLKDADGGSKRSTMDDKDLCKAIARTIGANILLTNSIKFNFDEDTVDGLYSTEVHTSPLLRCVSNSLQAASFDSYIPKSLLIPLKSPSQKLVKAPILISFPNLMCIMTLMLFIFRIIT